MGAGARHGETHAKGNAASAAVAVQRRHIWIDAAVSERYGVHDARDGGELLFKVLHGTIVRAVGDGTDVSGTDVSGRGGCDVSGERVVGSRNHRAGGAREDR